MKRLPKQFITFISFTACSFSIKAQQIMPAAYSPDISVNYIRTWDATSPQTNPDTLFTRSLKDVKQTTQYLDGLGRPFQTVIKSGSMITGNSSFDLVSSVVYDDFGREMYKYLPFAANSTGSNTSISDGLFKLNPFQQDSTFNKGMFSDENWYYSQTNFESSPLDRITKIMAPGNSWVGGSRGIDNKYWLNTLTDSVTIWNVSRTYNFHYSVTDNGNGTQTVTYYWTLPVSAGTVLLMYRSSPDSSWHSSVGGTSSPRTFVMPVGNYEYAIQVYFSDGTPTQTISSSLNITPATYWVSGTFPAGSLYKSVTVDENSKQVIEFKDKDGKTILKKVQLTAASDTGTGKGYTGWLCTYYIYDDFDLLRCVIQPRGVELLVTNSWDINALSGSILNEQCFRYDYDQRNRMITKKVPGAGTVWMVYDARDRLVMTQDSIMRSNHQWMLTQYDSLNRPFATGLLTDNSNYNNLSYYSTRADTSLVYPTSGTYTVDTLTKTFYDDYSWRAGQGNPLSATRSNSYDSYLQSATNTTWPYPQDATTQTNHLRGLVTGTKIKVLGTLSTYLYAVSFYDDKGRVIQSQSQNITTGTDIISTQYSWAGQPVLTIVKNEKAVTAAQTNIVLTQMTYDSLNRVTKIEKKASNTKVNSGAMPGTWKTIVQNEYDALGQLKKKKLGAAPLDSLNYEYNIRGWMLGMNRAYVKDTTSTANWFGFDLGYDKTSFTVNGNSKSYTAAEYNGNIEGMLWKSSGDGKLRKYDFTYDAVNRLTGADFNQLTNNSFSKDAKIDFSVFGLNYDANGNILHMNQKGWKVDGSDTIDSLVYSYIGNSNKLQGVYDYNNDTLTKLGDFRSSGLYIRNGKNISSTDYSYDANGNMYVDNNKDISNIHYNHLNLPDSITVTGKGNIKYVYDAIGNKLKKITTEGAKVTTTLYLFGNYVNDTLQYLPTEEGRIRYNVADSSLAYDYFVKDHLGNVRMLLTEQKQTDAYPDASLETATLTNEKLYYSGLDTGRVNKGGVLGYPNDAYTSPNDYIQQLSGNGAKIGAGIVLKVMAGDSVNIRANSWWKSINSPGTPVSPLTDLVSALTSQVGALAGSHGTTAELTSSGVLSTDAASFLSDQTYNSSLPKAFLNWILFDEQFNYVSSSSGFDQVASSNTFKTHTPGPLRMSKSGYLYIYVSNETPNINVFFDNLQVTHIRGPLLEETHYYPFGLTMNGISSKALAFGTPQNRYKFNEETELTLDFGIDWYETTYRGYDAQIGRFDQIDPQSDMSENWSPYVYVQNNPLLYNDPLGLDTTPTIIKHGKMVVKTDPQQGDVLKINNGNDTYSYYTYDPGNPDANSQGYVGTGTESTEDEVVVTAKANKKVLEYNFIVSLRKNLSLTVKSNPEQFAKIPEPLECGVGPKFISALRLVISNWSKATFRSVSASIRYHFKKHVLDKGIDKTLEEYTEDAINFFKNNKEVGKVVTLRSGQSGILIRTSKGPGGYFTPNGEVITFWYK